LRPNERSNFTCRGIQLRPVTDKPWWNGEKSLVEARDKEKRGRGLGEKGKTPERKGGRIQRQILERRKALLL